MTPGEIIYQRRIAVLAHVHRTGNVAQACRIFGISRTRYYEWKQRADAYGPDALMPKERRRPQMPSATPTHVVERLLTLAVVEPTIGCRQYADRLGDQGFSIAKSTVQKSGDPRPRPAKPTPGSGGGHHRLDHGGSGDRGGPRRRALRLLPGHGRSRRAHLHSFYIGKLKGVGSLYQLTAVDVFTRWAVVTIVLGPLNAAHSIRFIDHVLRRYRRFGITVKAVLTDGGPEYVATGFRLIWPRRVCATNASPPARPTTTPSVSASRAPSWTSAGDRPSTAGTSPPPDNSRPRWTPGSSPITTDAATTATTCGVEPLTRSSTRTERTEQHDLQPQSPPVTSNLGPEDLGEFPRPSDRLPGRRAGLSRGAPCTVKAPWRPIALRSPFRFSLVRRLIRESSGKCKFPCPKIPDWDRGPNPLSQVDDLSF